VRDALGAPISEASVSLRSGSLAYRASGRTDASGTYRFLRLVPATDYVIEVQAPQMEPWTRSHVVIPSGEVTTLDISLTVEAQHTEIRVEAPAGILSPESTELSSVITDALRCWMRGCATPLPWAATALRRTGWR
jgi:hypothetical protein